jgi:hypothetical protein
MAANRYDVIPGAALPLHLTVTDLDGAAVDLDGATVEATIAGGSGYSEAIAPSQVDTQTWLVLVGAAHTLALAGQQARLRAWVTPAASVETTAIEATINVKAA